MTSSSSSGLLRALTALRDAASAGVLSLVFACTPLASDATSVQVWTPVTARPLQPEAMAVEGVDGRLRVVYELELSNAGRAPALLHAIEVLDAERPDRPIAVFEGQALARRVRTLSHAGEAGLEIPPDAARLALLDVTFEAGAVPPPRLSHRLVLSASGGPGAASASRLRYTLASLRVVPGSRSFGPPLSGKGWVAINGCCGVDVGHRSTGLPIDGGLHFAQRFAIDWMKLDEQGRVLAGDPADPHSYPAYGAEVLAIDDAVVVDALDGLPDQTPPRLPPPSAITLHNVLGNHVILKIDEHTYAVFAHLQPGSLRVKRGERVRRGQVLGLLGNSGNSSAPHLHMHLMRGPSLGSDGVPYRIDRFEFAGQVPDSAIEAFYTFEGRWDQYRVPRPSPRRNQFPLHFVIIDFSQ